VQRPLWASTSTKNPRYRDVLYVEELVGPHTVNTMPEATLQAFRDHGRVARTVDTPEAMAHAQEVWRDLKTAGIDMDEVTLQLQKDGVRLFAESFDSLIKSLESRRQALAHA
jgi:transaldolase